MHTIYYDRETGRISSVVNGKAGISLATISQGLDIIHFEGQFSRLWRTILVENGEVVGADGRRFISDSYNISEKQFVKRESLKEDIEYIDTEPKPYQLTISIIRLIGLGDVLMTLQVALPSIRKAFPDAHITFWTSKTGARLLHSNPDIDCVRISDLLHGTSPIVEPLPEMLYSDVTVNLINRVDFLPVVTQTNRPDNLFNAAYDQIQTQTGVKIKKIKRLYPTYLTSASIDWYYDVCQDNGIDSDAIGCQLNSHGDMRFYPMDKWYELVRNSPNRKFLWFADNPVFENLNHVPDNVVNMSNQLSFSEFLTAWLNCKVCIGPDSGGMNISGTNNQRYIALAGSTRIKDHIVNYRSVKTVRTKNKLECMPCVDWQLRSDCKGQSIPWCMDQIDTRQISAEIDNALVQKKSFFKSARNHTQ